MWECGYYVFSKLGNITIRLLQGESMEVVLLDRINSRVRNHGLNNLSYMSSFLLGFCMLDIDVSSLVSCWFYSKKENAISLFFQGEFILVLCAMH